jgi:hypothetical protein
MEFLQSVLSVDRLEMIRTPVQQWGKKAQKQVIPEAEARSLSQYEWRSCDICSKHDYKCAH